MYESRLLILASRNAVLLFWRFHDSQSKQWWKACSRLCIFLLLPFPLRLVAGLRGIQRVLLWWIWFRRECSFNRFIWKDWVPKGTSNPITGSGLWDWSHWTWPCSLYPSGFWEIRRLPFCPLKTFCPNRFHSITSWKQHSRSPLPSCVLIIPWISRPVDHHVRHSGVFLYIGFRRHRRELECLIMIFVKRLWRVHRSCLLRRRRQ